LKHKKSCKKCSFFLPGKILFKLQINYPGTVHGDSKEMDKDKVQVFRIRNYCFSKDWYCKDAYNKFRY